MTAVGRRRTPVASVAVAMAWRAGGPVWLGTIMLALVSGTVSPVSAWVLKELIDHLTRPGPAVGLVVATMAMESVSQKA